ncbi:hypothetical protein CONPUDRAFT_75623 [Coniophora puteana RWD-64-598 SS2]|uniref:Uncharacterized protein n=1 Tax=Coniophora puteana (strain RWD-64-598) TaxID=741705 RepID=A0A5M3MFZ2_CONPW|nr:uncharacterized protein CONPUDRAFT_75623 [Coniophora puteana RWD-64-598 SS2]EIW77840.1 hypothetical protein CONPUDRAFT_75623 [Coniophora puteana RWD-64-598 SS2]
MAVPCCCTRFPLGRLAIVHVFLLHVMFSIMPCHVSASSERAFAWDFTNTSLRTSGLLTECQEIELSISPLPVPTPGASNNNSDDPSALGVPPYSLFVFEPGGTSSRTWIDPAAHSPHWVVNYQPGSQLVLGMVDSEGRPGGVLDRVFTVSQGDPTCMGSGTVTDRLSGRSRPSGIASGPNISSDLTVQLGEPWDISVSQGSPPYSILLAALGAPGPLLLPVPRPDNVLRYINQGSQNTRVLATVIDSTGTLGLTTPLVHFVGGPDANSAGVPQASTAYTASNPGSAKQRMRVPSVTGSTDSATTQTSSGHSGLSRTDIIIIAVVVPVVGIMFLCGLGRLGCVLRRHRKERFDAEPHPFPTYIPRPPNPPELPRLTVSPIVFDISQRNNSFVVESPQSNSRITPYLPSHERRPTSPISIASSPDRSPIRAPSRQRRRHQRPQSPPHRSQSAPRQPEQAFTYPVDKRPRQQRSSPALGAAAAHPQSAYLRHQRHMDGHRTHQQRPQQPQNPPQTYSQAPLRQLHPSRSMGDMHLQMGGGFRSFSSLREGRIPQPQWQYHHGHRYRYPVYEYANEPDEPEPIYFQHQDGGGAHPGLYEVPPPYPDDPGQYPDDIHDRPSS